MYFLRQWRAELQREKDGEKIVLLFLSLFFFFFLQKRVKERRGQKDREERKASGSAQRKSQGHSDQAYCNDFSLRSHIHAPPQRSYLHSACSASLHLQLLAPAAAAAALKSPGAEAPTPACFCSSLWTPQWCLRRRLQQARASPSVSLSPTAGISKPSSLPLPYMQARNTMNSFASCIISIKLCVCVCVCALILLYLLHPQCRIWLF